MYQTLDECLSAWNQTIKYGSKEERIERNNAWIKYYKYMSKHSGKHIPKSTYFDDVITFLKQEKIINETSSVLDIGSGVGHFTIAFGKETQQVHALDMDQESLLQLHENAQRLNLTNITSEVAMWEAYTNQDPFDIAFSSMCPAICNQEELLKLESIANDYCVIIAVNRGSYDYHRKELIKLLPPKHNVGFTSEAVWYYDALYLMERNPNIKTWEQDISYQIPLEEAIKQYTVYFTVFGYSENSSRPIIAKYFMENSFQNIVFERSIFHTSCIYWKVQK